VPMHIQWNHPLGGASVRASLNSAMSFGAVELNSVFAFSIGLSDTTILSACLISAASFAGSTGRSSFWSSAWQTANSANKASAKIVQENIKRGKTPNETQDQRPRAQEIVTRSQSVDGKYAERQS